MGNRERKPHKKDIEFSSSLATKFSQNSQTTRIIRNVNLSENRTKQLKQYKRVNNDYAAGFLFRQKRRQTKTLFPRHRFVRFNLSVTCLQLLSGKEFTLVHILMLDITIVIAAAAAL